MAISSFLALAVLNAIFNNTSFALGGNPYISLHTGNPGTTGANEVAGGTYARQQVNFNAAAAGSAKNAAAITWTLMPTATVTYIGVWDAVSAGNFCLGGALSESIEVSSGNYTSVDPASETLTLAGGHVPYAKIKPYVQKLAAMRLRITEDEPDVSLPEWSVSYAIFDVAPKKGPRRVRGTQIAM